MSVPIFVSRQMVEQLIHWLKKIHEDLDRIADEIDALEGRMRGQK